MILKNLRLKNFRKFKEAHLKFPEGLTGVIGLNGAGKSTIFEAIAWALYGPAAARTSSDQIRRENADPSEPCRVELEFIFEDEHFRVVREMAGKNLIATADVLINGKHVAKGAQTVNEYIQKKLGMDFKSFFTSIFAKQKELNALSSMNASERRPLILRMLGIDSLDKIIKEIKSDKRNKHFLIEKFERELIDKNGRDKIDKHREEIQKLKKEEKETLETIKKEENKISRDEKELRQLEETCNKNREKYEQTNLLKEKLEEQKTIFEKKEKLKKEIEKQKEKISLRKQNVEKLRAKLKDLGQIKTEVIKTEEKNNEIERRKEELIKKIERKKTILKTLEKKIDETKNKKEEIQRIGPDAKCPTCERELKEQYDVLIKKFDDEIKKSGGEIEKIKKEIENEEKTREQITRQLQAIQKKISYLQKQVKEEEKKETQIEEQLNELQREKKELEEKTRELKRTEDVKFDMGGYINVKTQLKKLYEKYKESLFSFNTQNKKINDAKLDLEKKQSDKKIISQKIKNLNEKIDELTALKKRVRTERKEKQMLNMLTDIMVSFRTDLISRIRPTLSSYASDFFSRLTDGKYAEMELNEKYDIIIYDQGTPYPIERFSGGEEDLANLCLRLAISEIITERAGGTFNFIILDEIFGSQDLIRRKNIIKALRGLSSKFKQILVITHIDELKDEMENVIYVKEDEEGNSYIELV